MIIYTCGFAYYFLSLCHFSLKGAVKYLKLMSHYIPFGTLDQMNDSYSEAEQNEPTHEK